MKLDRATLKSKKLVRFLRTGDASRVHPAHLARLVDVLYELRKAESVRDMLTDLKLHPLEWSKGRRLIGRSGSPPSGALSFASRKETRSRISITCSTTDWQP